MSRLIRTKNSSQPELPIVGNIQPLRVAGQAMQGLQAANLMALSLSAMLNTPAGRTDAERQRQAEQFARADQLVCDAVIYLTGGPSATWGQIDPESRLASKYVFRNPEHELAKGPFLTPDGRTVSVWADNLSNYLSACASGDASKVTRKAMLWLVGAATLLHSGSGETYKLPAEIK